ncbi:MAG: tetratricopeptide repeat protein [Bacteroidales bacterium]|nr:tetratricopeptide repeat protein [Bacteroidales bacterium]
MISKGNYSPNFINNRPYLWLTGIVFLTFFAYIQTFQFEFIYNWDDAGYVLKNEYIKKITWENIWLMLTKFYMSNYHPLTMLSYAIDYAVAGENPTWYHIINVLFHLINIILVFKLLYKITSNNYVSLIIAFLFALHPMHVESVAWISERKDVLYTFFFLLASIIYLDWLSNKKLISYLNVTIFFILSLLSKSNAVVFPVVCFVYDYLKQRKLTKSVFIEKLPWLLLSFLFGILALQSQEEAIQNLKDKIAWWEQLLLVNYGILLYLIKFFVPFKLSAFHPYPLKTDDFFPWYIYVLPFLSLILLSAYLIYGRKNKELTAGLLFFFVVIAPVIQLVPVGGALIADRYTYVPYLGLSFSLLAILNNFKQTQLTNVLLGIWLVLLALFTWNRIGYWKNGDVLFTDVLKKYPKSPFAWNNRGFLYWDYYAIKKYKDHPIKKDLYVKKAYEDYTRAIMLDTTFYQAYLNRAILLYNIGKPEEALADFHKVIRFDPQNKDALLGRANTLSTLKRYEEAIPDYDSYLKIQPNDAKAILWKSIALVKTHRIDEGLLHLHRSKALNPKDYEVYYWLGLAHFHQQRMDSAIYYFDLTQQYHKNFAEVWDWEALAYQQLKNYDKALFYYDMAIRHNPANCVSRINKAYLLISLEKWNESLEEIKQGEKYGCTIPPQLYQKIQQKTK